MPTSSSLIDVDSSSESEYLNVIFSPAASPHSDAVNTSIEFQAILTDASPTLPTSYTPTTGLNQQAFLGAQEHAGANDTDRGLVALEKLPLQGTVKWVQHHPLC